MDISKEVYKKVSTENNQSNIEITKTTIKNLAYKLDLTEDGIKNLYKNIKDDLRKRGAPEHLLSTESMLGRLQAKLKGMILDGKEKGYNLFFNTKPALTNWNDVSLFFKSTNEGDLYLKHFKDGDGFSTFWYILNGKKTVKSQIVQSKNSLAVSNDRRDRKLLKIAQDKYDLDVQDQLIEAAEFINNNFRSIFRSDKVLLKRSKKDRQLIQIADKLDKKYRILIHGLTGDLHIYNGHTGVYESYNEKEFSAFLRNEYGDKFLLDEASKIMGTFSKIKDESESYIAFKNCLLNIETLETEDFNDEEFVTFQVPYNWNPDAKSNYFEEKLKEILVDDLKFKFFKQFFGYIFTENNPYHLIVFLIGQGRNGKTTLTSIIDAVFDNSVSAIGLKDFESEFGKQPLLGKRINIIPDFKRITLKDVGYLKAVTGEDKITINRKYKEPVTTTLGCKVIGTGNHLPKIEEDTLAIWSRIRVIELTNTFNDPKVKKKMLNDSEGIEWFIYESIQAFKKRVKEGRWAIDKSEVEIRRDYFKSSDPCLYAAENLFVKTTDPDDYVTRHKVVEMVSKYLELHQLEKPKDVKQYYRAIRKMGGDDLDKKLDDQTTPSFCYIKPKDVLKDKDEKELTALAKNGDEEAQAELEARST